MTENNHKNNRKNLRPNLYVFTTRKILKKKITTIWHEREVCDIVVWNDPDNER